MKPLNNVIFWSILTGAHATSGFVNFIMDLTYWYSILFVGVGILFIVKGRAAVIAEYELENKMKGE